MPFIPVADTIQAELIYSWDGQVVQNVLHYKANTGGTQTEQGELGLALVTWFDTVLQPLVVSTLTLNTVRMTDLSSEVAPGSEFAVGLPLSGTLAGGLSLPNNCAIVMSKRTAFRGRSFRGRIYHPGLAESQVTNNALVPATLTSLLTAYNDLVFLAGATYTYTMQVVSRYSLGEPRITGLATEVTSITSDGVIDSQRRRLPGRGS